MDDKVILLNSNEVVDASPKLLNPDNVQYGELGVNYHKGTETISTKNDENGIAEFVPYSVYDEAIDNIQNEVFYETDEPIGKTGDVWIYKIPPIPMMIEYNVLADNLSVQLPISGNVNCDIEWGDGSKESVNSNYPTHSYIRAGVYVVKIVGDFNRLYRGSTNISKILNWGNSNMSLVTVEQAFSSYVNLTEVAGDEFGVLSRVQSFLRTFFNCSGLTTVSENLFKYCNAATNFSGTFLNCTSLSAITDNLFINCYNATNFSQVFQGCKSLTNIPNNLFANCINATNFNNIFNGCSNLNGEIPGGLFRNNVNVTRFDGTFNGCSRITSISEELFKYNTNVVNFLSTFYGCFSITSIPENLFMNNVNVTNFGFTFASCPNIIEIPENLFKYNIKATNFERVFYGLTKLQAIPNNVFDNNKNAVSFTRTFENCSGLTGNTPTGTDGLELWERAGQPGYPSSIYGTQCFYRATRLTNYSSIPTGWK